MVKLIIDYFVIEDITPCDDPQDLDFHLRLAYYLEHYLRNNNKFKIFFKLAHKDTRWILWDRYLKSIFEGYIIDYAISMMTDIFNTAKELNIIELMERIKIVSNRMMNILAYKKGGHDDDIHPNIIKFFTILLDL